MNITRPLTGADLDTMYAEGFREGQVSRTREVRRMLSKRANAADGTKHTYCARVLREVRAKIVALALIPASEEGSDG